MLYFGLSKNRGREGELAEVRCDYSGLVPVSENALHGGRLNALADAGLVIRYPHGDLEALRVACEQALAADVATRRRIYDHFNRYETVGGVMAEALAAAMCGG